jgi:hypothetical protein
MYNHIVLFLLYFYNFKKRITYWLNGLFPNKVKVISNDELIDWHTALYDAKSEQGLL